MADRFFSLYLVTDRKATAGRRLLEVVDAALQGGVGAVQLREKDLPARDLFALACALRPICAARGARLLINDRIDIALAARADGVHLPVNSFTSAEARGLVGPGALIGASAHDMAEARAAAAGGADFIVFGPVFDTPSKRALGAPVGLEALAAVARALTIPVLAIGGITAGRVDAVRRHGARGVAVISAILQASDPRAAAQELAGSHCQ